MGAMGHGGKKQQAKKKGSKSGNPAKRAQENAALAAGGVKPGSGAGFGFGQQAGSEGPSAEELEALQKMLGKG
jgi:signal recognition particle subunit SRP54